MLSSRDGIGQKRTLYDVTMIIRLLVVLASYALSSIGIMFMLVMIASALSGNGGSRSLVFIWLGAWFVHAVMSAAWVSNVRLSRLWPAAGLILGTASCHHWYIVDLTSLGPQSPLPSATGYLTSTQLLSVSPCILLALWLVRFHWGGRRFRLET